MRYTVLLYVLIISLGPVSSMAMDTLVLNTTGKPPLNTPAHDGFMDRVAAEALRRVGFQLRTVQLPAERGLSNVNAGIDDGEMSRIAGLEVLYPNLVRVPEKIMRWEFNIFSDRDIAFNGQWQDLNTYAVAYINGWKILEKNVPAGAEVTKVKNPAQLFGLLSKGRTEVIIYERWGGLNYIQANKMQNVRLVQPPLAVRDMYIYLHKKHAALVGPLAKVLIDMKKDGSYQRIYDETLQPLMSYKPKGVSQ